MNTKERVRRWIDGELDASEGAALLAEAARRPDLARELEAARRVAGDRKSTRLNSSH